MSSNIGPIQPPPRPRPSENDKNKSAESQKFREAMKRESEKVGENDSQNQKTRKQKQEAEIEKNPIAAPEEPIVGKRLAKPYEQGKKVSHVPLKGSPVKGKFTAPSSTYREKEPTGPQASKEGAQQTERPRPEKTRDKEKDVEEKPITAEERMSERGMEREKPKEPIEEWNTPSKKEGAKGIFPGKEEVFVEKEEKKETVGAVPTAPSVEQRITEIPPSKKEEKEPIKFAMAAPPPSEMAPPAPLTAAAPAAPLPPYVQFSQEMLMMFERMIGVMTVMNASGIKETTMLLTSPQFESSPFYETEIVIREFSTAPTAYNVSINASPQALAILQPHLQRLVDSFQYEFLHGKNRFSVQRIDTGVLREKSPRVQRKKPSGEEGGTQ